MSADIIIAAAASPLGIIALIVLSISTIATVFFKDASHIMRFAVFIMIIVSFGTFGFAMLNVRDQDQMKSVTEFIQVDHAQLKCVA